MQQIDYADLSPWEQLSLRPEAEQQQFLASLSAERRRSIRYDWTKVFARPKQLPPPGDWLAWLILSGRGWGKTRTGAETVRHWVETGAKRIALVGRTGPDVRNTMIEGESGILAMSPPWDVPEYMPGLKRLIWRTGAVAQCYSGDEPDQLRGPQAEKAWVDEPAHWKRAQKSLDNLFFGLRLGDNPQCIATTTPLPTTAITGLAAKPTTVITKGSSYENRANVTELYYQQNIAPYEGTRIGRQEIYGDILDDVPGALWTRARLDENRVGAAPDLVRIVIAVDPAVTSNEESDETGIIVAGKGVDGHAYILADLTCRLPPPAWADRVDIAYNFWRANSVIGEVNNGGDLVKHNVWSVNPNIPFRSVHASRSKYVRAEPVATMDERGMIHHCGKLDELEDQMCVFTPEGGFSTSPDRVDARVWAIWDLMIEPEAQVGSYIYHDPVQISPF